MRKVVLTSMLAVAMVMGSACKEPDPNAYETHLAKIQDSSQRATGFRDLQKLVKAVASAPDNETRVQEFADKVIPVFESMWEQTPEYRESMLIMLRDMGHPGGAPVWNLALPLDGSSEARKQTLLALEGIKKAKATGSTGTLITELTKLMDDPKNDAGKEAGRLRMELIDTLGELEAVDAVPLLVKALKQTKENQPVAVHRQAAKSLGMIGDPSAVDALLTASFRVPDVPSTTDIFNRTFLALVSIGKPALPGVLKMFRGEHVEVNELAAEHGLDVLGVQQTAAKILGGMGYSEPVEELIAFMPKADCGDSKIATNPMDAGLRAVVARALGFIGDERAVEHLCLCSKASHNPGDMWEIAGALGRIGGDAAVDCLVELIKTGEYDTEAVDSSDFQYEIRWEAARYAILAAGNKDLEKIKAAIATNTDKNVKNRMKAWDKGIEVLEECKDDKACYNKTLQNASADWFAREKAAFEIARLAPGDEAAALEVAKAFKVRNPDARVSMAVLPVQMLGDKKCQPCVVAYDNILKAEKGSMDPKNQLAVLKARHAMAKLRVRGTPAPSAAPKEDAKADAKAEPPAEEKEAEG
jgi:HEAT repeat protein